MAYIEGLIVAGLFFTVLHYFTELSKSQKIIATALTLAIILTAIAYNTYVNKNQEKMMAVVLKFKQNKNIKCGDIDVNSTNYTLSIGTYTFIGKKGTPNYAQMISASTCQ